MPNSISSRFPPNPHITTTGGTATTNATSAPPTTQPQLTVVGNPHASGAPLDPPRKASGFPKDFDLSTIMSWLGGAGAKEGMTGTYVARPSAGSFVAYGDITRLDPTSDGFELDITAYTQKSTDKVALMLLMPVFDKKSAGTTYVVLDMMTYDAQAKTASEGFTTAPTQEPISGGSCFSGRKTYKFSLDQLNALVKKMGLDLQIKPGDQLAIAGLIDQEGHRIMNSASNSFAVPAPLGSAIQSPIGIQTGDAQVQKAADLPLDISLKLSKSVLDSTVYKGYPTYESKRVGDVIVGDITTRLESEYKGSVDEAQMGEMLTKAYELCELSEKALAGDKRARRMLDRLLGKDLVLTPVKRHWLADDGKPVGERDPSTLVIPKDAEGRPTLDPMVDKYSDDEDLTFSKLSGAVRIRGNAQKEGHAEFKLDGGVLDPSTGIRQRVELGLSLQPGATEDDLKLVLKDVRDNKSSAIATSPLGHLIKEAEALRVSSALIENRTPWADVVQVRHKFELKNTATGTSAELSLDKVTAKTLRPEHEVNGQAQERTYFVIESELDHLQINSSNVTELEDVKTKSALISYKEQTDFLEQAAKAQTEGSAEYELLRQPQLHGAAHIKDGTFRKTPSYKDFEAMNAAILKALCGENLPGPARQKSAHFAELLGLIPPEMTATV